MRLTPDTVLGWWVALGTFSLPLSLCPFIQTQPSAVPDTSGAADPTDVSNGCMQLWPGSQYAGIVPHHLPVRPSPAAHIYYSVRDAPPPAEAVAVPMQPGDALIFNVSCVRRFKSIPSAADRPLPRVSDRTVRVGRRFGAECYGQPALGHPDAVRSGPLPRDALPGARQRRGRSNDVTSHN